MKKLFLISMLVAGLMLGSCVGTGNKGSMTPSATILPDVKYTELDFFNDGTPYYIPSHIRVLEQIWMPPSTSRLNDTIITMNFEMQTEQVTFVVDDVEMEIRAMLYRYKVMGEIEMTENRENYIYDGKPYPVKVTDAEMKIYMDTLAEQGDI